MYNYTGSKWSHRSSDKRFKRIFEAVPGNPSIDHGYTRNSTHNAGSLIGGDRLWFKITGRKASETRDIIIKN